MSRYLAVPHPTYITEQHAAVHVCSWVVLLVFHLIKCFFGERDVTEKHKDTIEILFMIDTFY